MKQNIQLSDHFTYGRLFRFVLPSVVMMIFTSIYSVVDGLFVSNFVGKTAFASINLVMPFVMIIGGVGFMVGTGGTALVAKVLGEGDGKKANKYFSMMALLVIIIGVILSVIGVIFMPAVAEFLGASENMMNDCVTYGRIVIAFTTAFMLQNLFQSFFVVAEKPNLGLAATVAAGVMNMILDALFVGVFRWGVVGAAVATGISQCIGGVLPLFYFLFPNSSLLRLTKTGLELKPIVAACTNGASELMSNISSSIVGMLYNFQLMKYAGEDGVSAYGVIMYVLFIFISVYIGYSIGSAPIVGYNYGSQNHTELKSILKKSYITMIVCGVFLTVLSISLSAPLSRLFVGYDEALTALTIRAFIIYSFHFIIAGINIFTSSFFTALNNGAISAAVSFLRTLVFQTASVLILPIFFETDGIWFAVNIAEVMSVTISLIFLFAKKNKYHYM